MVYMPRSVMGANLINALQPWMTDQLAWWIDAMGSMFDPVYSLVYDVGVDGTTGFVPGYGTLLDPRTCPVSDLPYLAQFVGVQIPPGTDAPTARALVIAESGQARGTVPAVKAAIARSITQPWLPGSSYANAAMVYVVNPTGTIAYYVAGGAVTVPLGASFDFATVIPNLEPNPSFEHDTVGFSTPALWTVSGTASVTTHQVQNGWAAKGSQSLRLTGSFTGSQEISVFGPTTSGAGAIPVTAGQTYTLAVVVNNLGAMSSPISYELFINWRDSGGTLTGSPATVTASIQAAGTVQQIVVTGVAPVGAALAQPLLEAVWNGTGTVDFYMDAIQFMQTTGVVAYGDGDADPYTWSGTAGASSSVGAWSTVDPSTQYVIVERVSPNGLDAYHLSLTVHGSQLTPASNMTALLAALESVKPGGIVVDVTLI